MYRKRRTVPPHFRLPVPYNPVSGSDAPLHPPFKPYCRFTLEEELTTSDEQVTARTEDKYQWGPGMYHCSDVILHVHNFAADGTDTYVFSGDEGDYGFAVWDRDNHWRIIWMGNGGLRGGCLDENHPGRGTAFDIHLGIWDAAQDKWVYDTDNTAAAIDWRYGVPYPDAGATGLFEARRSDAHGVIWECVSLDCESPGPCS